MSRNRFCRHLFTVAMLGVWMLWGVSVEGKSLQSQPKLGHLEKVSAGCAASKVVWADVQSKVDPIFIPQSVLEARAIGDLPGEPADHDYLASQVEKFQDPRWGYRCNRPDNEVTVQGTAKRTLPFVEYIDSTPVVLRAEIIQVVPGWNLVSKSVVEMAYLRVVEVLGDALTGAPGVDDVVAVTFPGGRTVAAGTPICEERRPGFYEPKVGDEIVIGGQLQPGNPSYFRARYRFPILDGEVRAQPLAGLERGATAMQVDELRKTLRMEGRDPEP